MIHSIKMTSHDPRSEARTGGPRERRAGTYSRRFVELSAAIGLAAALARALAHDGAPNCHDHPAAASAPGPSADRMPTLTAAAEVAGQAADGEVEALRFAEFYVTPLGPRGLEYTPRLRQLSGRRVQIAGYMVRSRHSVPGTLLLTPYPVKVDDCHYGLADDLPPQTLHVTVPAFAGRAVPFAPGLLRVTGTVELGPQEQPDGRNFAVRLALDGLPGAVSGTDLPKVDERPPGDRVPPVLPPVVSAASAP